jgi:ribosomal-protein-alanine N-acetyltransferase
LKKYKQKIYRTKRLELRELRASDWQAWAHAHETALPKQNEWDITPVPASRRQQSRFKSKLAAQTNRFRKSGTFLWAMFLRETGEFIGWMDISTIARDRYQMANLGWFTMNRYRGHGYAKEAVTKLISAAFSDLDFHRLEASIDPRNKPSIELAKSLGLHYEGVKKFYLKDDDRWRDHVVYITTPELFYER